MAEWQDYMTTAALAEDTIALRVYHLGRLARDLDVGPAEVTAKQLTRWLAEQVWSPNTRKSYRSSLRAFYAWAVQAELVATSPAHLHPSIRVPRGKPRPTPEAAFRRAVARAGDRERLAILLAGVCGLRRSEVARCRREDVERDLLGWALRVRGKGGHERLVPMPDYVAVEVLARPAGWLFPSPAGGHLTPHHLAKMVTRWLPADYTMHTLRHRCGTVAYAATHDLRAVQELLGHAKPETTAIYTEVPGQAIRAAVEGAA